MKIDEWFKMKTDYLEYRIVCIWKGSDCGTKRRAHDQRVSVALKEWV